MPATRKQYEDARTVLDNLRRVPSVVLSGDVLAAVTDQLGDMLGGDPWQEGESAVAILKALEPALGAGR